MAKLANLNYEKHNPALFSSELPAAKRRLLGRE